MPLSMKSLALPSALLALTLASTAAFAQAPIVEQPPTQTQDQSQNQPPAPMHHHDGMRDLHKLKHELNLTPDQTSQIRPILMERHQQMEALKANTTLPPDQAAAQRRQIMHESMQKIDGILTDSQRQQLASLRAEHRQQHQNQPEQPAAPPSASL